MKGLPVSGQVVLLIGLFVAGWLLRRRAILTPAHAGKMLQLVITVGLPCLFLADVSRVELHRELIGLPLSAVFIMLVTLALTVPIAKKLMLDRPEQGAMVLCAMSINNAFLFPFVLAAWGSEAFAKLALLDFGHALMQASVVYVVATLYGKGGARVATVVERVLKFPLLWALIAALAINISGWRFPEWATTTLGTAGRLILLLVVLALGVLFDAKLLRSRAVIPILLLRIGVGAVLGFAIAELMGWQGSTRAVLLLAATAPVGFTAVVLAHRESLQRDLAASAASVSVLLGLIYVPLLLWLLKPA